MKSRNLGHALLVGYYLTALLFLGSAGSGLLGSGAAFLGLISLVFPVALFLQRRSLAALLLMGMTGLFAGTLLLMQANTISLFAFREMLADPPAAVFAFLFLLSPGLYLVLVLDPDCLPHEVARLGHSSLVQPLLIVIATRERILRRLQAIQEVCRVRGIELTTKRQHLRRSVLWAIPLATSTLCEAAYAASYREMLGCDDSFIPTRPRRTQVSALQRWLARGLILAFCLGILRSLVS
ncbi:hypothetical protein ACGF5M_00095 [Gemmatimonadota bacterium]